MLAGAHNTCERRRHTEMYLNALKVQNEGRMELPLDMVSFHSFLFLYLERNILIYANIYY